MLDDILREIVTIIVGKGAEPIADLLHSKRYVNEFTIAKKLEITINQTRNILYKIENYGLISSERQKDKKKGWYTYYWKFEILKCLEFLKKKMLERKEQFNTQINRREEKNYYVCEDCNIECSEDEALLKEFTCDECGELFTQKDNTQLLRGLKRNSEKIDEKLEIIEIEISKEKVKLNRKKQIQLRKEEKEKEAKKEEAKIKRAEKKAERDALKAKEKAEKEKNKPAKKKSIKKTAKKKDSKKKTIKKKITVKKKVVKSKKKTIKKKINKTSVISKSGKKIVKKKR